MRIGLLECRKHLGAAQNQYPTHPEVRAKLPRSEYRSVGILGAGTAGHLTALAMRKFRPDLDVMIISSSKIPVIGVGESTTSEMPPFLHGLLGLDIHEFYKQVKPTWKFGIRKPVLEDLSDGDTRPGS